MAFRFCIRIWVVNQIILKLLPIDQVKYKRRITGKLRDLMEIEKQLVFFQND